MTKQEILDGNRLIAEFMGLCVAEPRGWTVKLDGTDDYDLTFPIECEFWDRGERIKESVISHYLEFHSSYDWLMPVVEKIASMKFPINVYFSHIQNCTTVHELRSEALYLIRESNTIDKPIEILFKAVVEFIKGYNK